jgi:NhaP-type Na+/H+ or K+/H+ antiporter
LPPPPPRQALTIISWAGMRGVVSLAVALSLPQTTASGAPLPGRAIIIFITFAVILVTLLGQGLTLPALIRRIGTGSDEEREGEQEVLARLRIARRALRELDELGGETSCQAEVVERVRGNYADRIERLEHQRDSIRSGETAPRSVSVKQQAATRKLMGKLLQIEQAELQRMRTDFDVDNQVAQRIQSTIDLQRARDER